jgi:rhamnosyltransferase subunit B
MADFLLSPAGSHGDVHPYIAIGLALKARGHIVRMSTSPHFESLARNAGFDFAPVGTEQDFLDTIHDPDLWHPQRSLNVLFGHERFNRHLRENYAHLAEWSRGRPAVIVAGSLAVGARLVQEKLGVPLATVHLQPMAMPSVTDPPTFPGPSPKRWWPHWLTRGYYWLGERHFIDPILAPTVNPFRRELGLPPQKRIWGAWRHSPLCCLGLFPEWFGRARDWPAHMHCPGFIRYDQADTLPLSLELERFLANGDKPVVVSFGSAMRTGKAYFDAAVQAITLSGKRGVLLAREGDQIPANLPNNVLHVPYAPFSRVFPRAAAVLHHGGVGSCAQAMAAGVPQVVMPLAFDQFDNAARLMKLGVARSVPANRFTAKTAQAALESLLNDESVPAYCHAVKLRMPESDGLTETVRVLESLIGERGA